MNVLQISWIYLYSHMSTDGLRSGIYFPSWEFVMFREMRLLLWIYKHKGTPTISGMSLLKKGRDSKLMRHHMNGLFHSQLFISWVRNQMYGKGGYCLPRYWQVWTGHWPFNSKDHTLVCHWPQCQYSGQAGTLAGPVEGRWQKPHTADTCQPRECSRPLKALVTSWKLK